jgi:hypothetical protein
MPRAKKTPLTPSNVSDISAAPPKRVSSVTDPANSGSKTNGDLEAAIRTRAYQLYEQRGRTDGLAQEDWVRAEKEILAQQGKRSA